MKVSIQHINLLVFISLYLGSCVESFDPEIPDSNKSFLVVDGIITDQPGPYVVKVTQSTSVNGEITFVSGISMFIEDENGTLEELIETNTGVYQTSALQGEVGKSYRLNFNYLGEQYQSTWETINVSPTIDSVYFEVETRETSNKDVNLSGIQFYIDSQGPEDGSRYFRYEFEETWRIFSFWPSFFDYIGNDNFKPTENPVYTCWRDESPVGINIATTKGLSQNRLAGHPISFTIREGDRFTKRYSLLVKQFALDEEEFLFWKDLKESNEELGSLFDKQPARISGNIANISNSQNIALGYFSASGLTEQRIFIGNAELPSFLTRPEFCADLDTLFKANLGAEFENKVFERIDNGFFFYQFHTSDISGSIIGALISVPRCSDCRLSGGSLTKPEFWDE